MPFVSRERYAEMLALKSEIIAERDIRIAELDAELCRLMDMIFKEHFGVQLHDTIAEEKQIEEPEPVLTSDEIQAKRLEEADDVAKTRLEWISRTRPSLLSREQRREFLASQMRKAEAARPVHPSRAMFNEAIAEARKQ